MRQQFAVLLLGAVLLVGAAMFVRIRTVPPQPSVDDETLWGMALEQAKLGYAQQAIQIANRIYDPDTRETALQGVADALIERGDFQNAIRAIRSLTDPYSRILYFSSLVRAGKLPERELEKLAEEAERDARKVRSKTQSKFAWGAICRMWIQLGEVERAWEAAQKLTESQFRHGLWGEIAVLFAQRGEIEKALKIAAQLPDKWEREPESPQQFHGFSLPRGGKEPLTNRQAVLKAIASSLAQQGKLEKAIEIAQTLENEAARSQVLNALADARKRVGMPPVVAKAAEKALEVTQKLERRLGTYGLFQPLTKPLAEQVWLSKALNDARKLPDPVVKVDRFVSIAEQLQFRSHRKETIAAILAEAAHYAREIKSPSQKAFALEKIARVWERLGDWEKAKKLRDEAMRMRQRLSEVWGLEWDILMNALRKRFEKR